MNRTSKHRVVLMVKRPQSRGVYAWEVFAWCRAATLDDAYRAADVVWRREVKGRGVTAWSYIAQPGEAKQMLEDPSYVPDGGSGE